MSSAGKALGWKWEGDYVGTFSYFQIFGFYAKWDGKFWGFFVFVLFWDGKLLERYRVININIIITRSLRCLFLFCGDNGWGAMERAKGRTRENSWKVIAKSTVAWARKVSAEVVRWRYSVYGLKMWLARLANRLDLEYEKSKKWFQGKLISSLPA